MARQPDQSGDRSPKTRPARGRVTSVQKAIDILRCFREGASSCSLSDIASRVGIPKSTAHALVKTLESNHLLEREPSGNNYRLGVEVFKLGYVAKSAVRISPHAFAVLENLLTETGEVVYFAIPQDGQVLYLEALYPTKRAVSYSSVGRVGPMHCTGLGKAMLADMSADEVSRIVRAQGLTKFTENTIVTEEGLAKELRAIRERGYATDHGEHNAMVACVAAAVRSGAGDTVGAISVSGPILSFSQERVAELASEVTYASSTVSRYFDRPIFAPTDVAPEEGVVDGRDS